MVEPARTRKLTTADFAAFPEDGRRHELIDGEHVVSPSPDSAHQQTSMSLSVQIGAFLARHRHLGRVYAAPFDVVLSEHDVVEPDLLFVSTARAAQVTRTSVQGPPDLAIEILSPSTRRRDLGVKLRLYESAGVDEYWVLDPEAETATVFRRATGAGLQRVADLRRGDGRALTTPLLPGLEIDLAELFWES